MAAARRFQGRLGTRRSRAVGKLERTVLRILRRPRRWKRKNWPTERQRRRSGLRTGPEAASRRRPRCRLGLVPSCFPCTSRSRRQTAVRLPLALRPRLLGRGRATIRLRLPGARAYAESRQTLAAPSVRGLRSRRSRQRSEQIHPLSQRPRQEWIARFAHALEFRASVGEYIHAYGHAPRQVSRKLVPEGQFGVPQHQQQVRVAAGPCIPSGQRAEEDCPVNFRAASLHFLHCSRDRLDRLPPIEREHFHRSRQAVLHWQWRASPRLAYSTRTVRLPGTNWGISRRCSACPGPSPPWRDRTQTRRNWARR